ncbi:MAG: hypothetical protein ACKPKO_65705, partial [Candidatus Fonsibacter sp.]
TAFDALRALVGPVAFDVPKRTLPPYLDFDIITNRVIVHAEQIRYDEPFLTLTSDPAINIFFNERLFDLFVGMQYTFESNQGNANYRLRVAYNGSNLVTRDVVEGYDAVEQAVTYVPINYVQMFQKKYLVLLSGTLFPLSYSPWPSFPLRRRRRRCLGT